MIFKNRFNRNEFAGAFGDIGTDFPLILAMLSVSDLNATLVFLIFGIAQIISGFIYKLPMPVQPLKAVASLVIAQKLSANIIYAGGLSIGILMLFLSLSGLLNKLNRIIPTSVVRGLQFGLGLNLALLSLKEYIPNDGWMGYLISFISFILILILIKNKKIPISLIIIVIGFVFTFIYNFNSLQSISYNYNFNLIGIYSSLDLNLLFTGFIVLALPQVPLSLGNSILATNQICKDYFPERNDINVTKIGLTYSVMNIIIPFLGGIPVCHGSGGFAGHYNFGARTGGSVIIYGAVIVILGLIFGSNIQILIKLFPLSILGTILFFEGIFLMLLIKDQISNYQSILIVFIVGVISAGLKYGFVVSIIIGTLLYYFSSKFSLFKENATN